MLPNLCAQIAQLVEQRTENPRVAGSIPALGIRGTGEDDSEIEIFSYVSKLPTKNFRCYPLPLIIYTRV